MTFLIKSTRRLAGLTLVPLLASRLEAGRAVDRPRSAGALRPIGPGPSMRGQASPGGRGHAGLIPPPALLSLRVRTPPPQIIYECVGSNNSAHMRLQTGWAGLDGEENPGDASTQTGVGRAKRKPAGGAGEGGGRVEKWLRGEENQEGRDAVILGWLGRCREDGPTGEGCDSDQASFQAIERSAGS